MVVKITASKLRQLIDETRLHWLQSYQTMERYEAIIHNSPGIKYLPNTKIDIFTDLENLRAEIKKKSDRARKATLELEKILAEDEAVNGWKGEDRQVEV